MSSASGGRLLIIRDALRGISRFDGFHASLGMARSVLTARLRKLTEQGVLERRVYSAHPPRYEWHLTDKGKALYPIMVSMVQWGRLGAGTRRAANRSGARRVRKGHPSGADMPALRHRGQRG